MMKKRIIAAIIICALAIAGGVLLFTRNNAEYVEKPDETKVASAIALLTNALGEDAMYCDWIDGLGTDSSAHYGSGSVTASPDKIAAAAENVSDVPDGFVSIDYNESVTYRVNVSQAGLYSMKLMYVPTGSTMSDFAVSMSVNGEVPYHEMKIIALPQMWSDETKEYLTDSYGDQMAPKQVRNDDIRERYLYSSTYISDEPLMFMLNAGENEITFTNIAANGLGLGTLTALRPADEQIGYEAYIAGYAGKARPQELITVNAIDYTKKNSTQAIYMTEADPAALPYDVHYKKLNTVKFTEAGTELYYELDVKEEGLYALSFHYTNEKEEYDAFESIYIDGEIPFAELKSYAFAPTGTTWTNETLSDKDGNPYLIYLTAGKHELCLKEEQENV
ncbi:MAG: hypothetical protein IKX80_01920, partial [Lachnospiraceae bacterium]|nr:hypothetical protein [Lachnospiraceae bacterium]